MSVTKSETYSETGNADTTAVSREYELRLATWQNRLKDVRSTDRLFMQLRVAAFAAIVFTGVAWLGEVVSWYWVLLPMSAFGVLLRLQNSVIRRLQRSIAAVGYYEAALLRLQGEWRSVPADGAEFRDALHPWSGDLDVFGPGSIFQRVNQCRTQPGRRRLAEWLTTVPDADTAQMRLREAESLREQLDLRESLAVISDTADWRAAEATIQLWTQESASIYPKWTVWSARAVGVVSVVALVMMVLGMVNPLTVFMLLLVQGPFVWVNRDRVAKVMRQVDSVDKALKQLAEVTEQFETFPLTEKTLQQLQLRFTVGGINASDCIRRLSTLIQWQNNALRNQFFIPMAWALGLFVHLPYRIDRWRASYGDKVAEWMDAIASLEAITSISGFSYEENGCLPEITDEKVLLTATQLGHPLIPGSECRLNDVSLTAEQPLILISGSNMSGKSTLLRAIGANLILAFCGARVRAESFVAHPFQPGTAMRVSDSLQEGRSLFFSVVQRLKSVVDLTRQDRPVLFLLDEILSGTNSHDRRRGAEAVIHSLVEHGALGLVTTHDLALTRIVESMDGRAVNKHFQDHVEDGQMSFDFQLREGVVERSNAIELMRMMGLDV